MNKTKRSLLGSYTGVIYTILIGIFNLIVVRQIIAIYGSDFNGLNSTAAQFISILLVVEGGFTLAANVALFKPLTNGDTANINGILSAVNKKFIRISVIFIIVGFFGSFIFAFLIKSELNYLITFSTFSMLVLSTGFNLFYSAKYKILFQSEQKEYVLNVVLIIFLIFSNIALLIAISLNFHMLLLRLIVMCFSIASGIFIAFLCKKQYSFIDFKVSPDNESIIGTNDVLAQKLTGVLYFAMPILFISTFVGTIMVSIYAVYNTVFTLMKSLSRAFINGPRMSLGRLISDEQKNKSYILQVFNEYEFLLVFMVTAMLSVSTVTIMYFVNIYTSIFNDSNYINWNIAVLLTIISFVEVIHIPSGNLINMAGKFRIGRNIQILGGILLIISLTIGGIFFGLFGILFAVLFTAILLSVLEIGYVRTIYFKGSFKSFFKLLSINLIVGVVIVIIEMQLTLEIKSFLIFFIYAGILSVINSVILLISNLVFNNGITMNVINRLRKIFKIFS